LRLGGVQVLADVLEDLTDDRAQEEQGDDHNDRDEGEQQAVLDERLPLLVVTLEARQKSADEGDHVVAVPPFREDLLGESTRVHSAVIWADGPTAPECGPYLAPQRSCLSRVRGHFGESVAGGKRRSRPLRGGFPAPEEETRDRR